jgi:putative phosphoserine phosphatase/1-acylglycerol-3-phosphate O-acyltransferase
MTDRAPRRPRLADLLRTFAALAAILPGLAAGAATLAWTRDRRRALNLAIGLWGRQGLRAAGIALAVKGASHLRLRPAVFTLNHQSGIDPILVCALLERDFVGVAKAEIRLNPLLGPAFAFVDTVFLDRDDRAQAIRRLQPAVATLERGLAIAIAPEGIRIRRGDALGRFKKGAFRLAMAARVPIVPIVIHNSHDILPRGGWVMVAGTVDVTVHPPVDTRDWRLADLDKHVAELEALYAETLTLEPDTHGPR